MPVLGHLKGTTKEEVIDNMNAEQKRSLLHNWFNLFTESRLATVNEIDEAIAQMDLYRVFDLRPEGVSVHLNYTKCYSTEVPSFDHSKELRYFAGKEFEHNETIRGPGYLHVSRYGHLEQPKALQYLLLLKRPWLSTFRYEVYCLTGNRQQWKHEHFYVNCERQLYVPFAAFLRGEIDPIIAASSWAAKSWPNANIYSDEFDEQCPEASRFLRWVKDGPPDDWANMTLPRLPGESRRKFYCTVLEVEILSEDKLDEETASNLASVHDMITYGDCSGQVKVRSQSEVGAKTAARKLREQGSDPGFFRLNDDGSDMEDI